MKIELNKEELEALIKESIAQGKQVESFKVVWFGDFSRQVSAISCKVEFEEKTPQSFIFLQCPSCGYEYHPREEDFPESEDLICFNCPGVKLQAKFEEEGLVEKPKQSMPKRLLVN